MTLYRLGGRKAALTTVFLFTVVCLTTPGPRASAADQIVLRDLTIISDRKVTAFDVDGIQLDDGKSLTWDQVEKASIGEQQAEFDALLKQLGNDLYRLRRRLTDGDYEGLLPHAEALYPRYVGRTSATAYWVAQATMWARLAAAKREAALAPYLRCFSLLRDAKKPVALPGERKLRIDLKTGLSPELAPIWFNAEAARQNLPKVAQAIRAIRNPPAGARIYYASMSLAAGDTETAPQILNSLPQNMPQVGHLRDVLLAQREVQMKQPGAALVFLGTKVSELSPQHRALASFWLGRAGLMEKEESKRRAGVLRLLELPALYGNTQPELAAAGLFHTIEPLAAMDDTRGSVAVRRELFARYNQTFHAAQARKALQAKKTKPSSP